MRLNAQPEDAFPKPRGGVDRISVNYKTIDITRRQSAQNQAAGLLHSKTDWREDHDNG